jgi:hypothetical protein
MIKKVVVLAVVMFALAFGSAFAADIDSLTSGNATSVYVNPGGTGDALLYGYYNVRDNNQTFFTVTNTDNTLGARVRLRFREAATLTGESIPGCENGSQEVLDFDICLSRNDVWSGRIVDVNGVATLKSTDDDTAIQVAGIVADCADPLSVCKDSFAAGYPSGQAFKFGANNLDITADQTREGYFEIIAENALTEDCGSGTLPDCTCGDLLDTTIDVGNVLMGHAVILNLTDTATFAYAATSLADFASGEIFPDSLAFGGTRPNLRDDSEDATIDPVNYALTKSNIYAVYDIESVFGAKANLVVTFPTKWATHDDTWDTDECLASPDDIFDDPRTLVQIFDDAENLPESETCEFSPCQPGETVETPLPHEVNVLEVNTTSDIFTSDVVVALTTSFNFGWINIDLDNEANVIDRNPNYDHITCTSFGYCSEGLPAIGYSLEKFAGGKFSGLIPLQYSTIAYQLP